MPGLTALLSLANLLVTLTAISCGLYLENDPRPFLEERSLVTWFSAVQLVGTGGIALAVWSVRRCVTGQKQTPQLWQSSSFLWLLVALGFFFLAIDEVTLLHETADRDLHRFLSLSVTPLTDRLDDLIVALYGVGGLVLLFRYRTELVDFRSLLPLLVLGGGFFCGMLGLDVLTNGREAIVALVANDPLGDTLHRWGGAVEEGCKLMSEGIFLSLAYQCLCRARQLSPRRD